MIFVRTFLLLAQFFGILYASYQHDLRFCPDHLEQKNVYFTFCAVLGIFLLDFLGFGSWETCVAEEFQQSGFGVAQNVVK